MSYKPDQLDFFIQVVLPGDPAPAPGSSCSETALINAVGSTPAYPTIQVLPSRRYARFDNPGPGYFDVSRGGIECTSDQQTHNTETGRCEV